jgi:hypothetical protein
VAEKCTDGIDNNCDSFTDTDDSVACNVGCADGDGDGYWCNDCNDGSAAIHPGAAEICNNAVDDDCNGSTPDVFDGDGDGSLCNLDCNDADPAIRPGAAEITCDGVDNDCNAGTSDDVDADADTFACGDDCNDANALVHPARPEITCDGIDNDCNPATSDLMDGDVDGFVCVALGVRGAGLSLEALGAASSIEVLNNTVVDNSTLLGIGGGMWLDDLLSNEANLVANNAVVQNSALVASGIDHSRFSGQVRANDLSGNVPHDLYDAGGSGAEMAGNLFLDPKFQSGAFGNYRPRPDSPLIDAADPDLAPATDIDRYPRPVDGDDDMVALPDIGAYEYPSGEVLNLRFVGKHALAWDTSPGDPGYNLYRGSIARLRNFGRYTQTSPPEGAQFCDVEVGEVPFSDPFMPSAGVPVFYIVTLAGDQFEGTLGADSFGAIRPNDNPCP